MSRVAYAVIALPILLLFQAGSLLSYYTPLVLGKLGADLTNFATWTILIFLIYHLMVIPLILVSAMRLRDIGLGGYLAGFLALPYLVRHGVDVYVGWTKVQGSLPSVEVQHIVSYLSAGAYIYGLVLALILLVIPGRMTPAEPEPAAA